MIDHAEYASFIRAVIADPDNDLPRLLMADWLQERGEDARAEFVRVQCELARNQQLADIGDDGHLPKPVQKYHDRLRRRERELLAENEHEWFQFNDIIRVGVGGRLAIQRDWRRGFVEEITCSWPDWQRHADAIRAATPLRRVNLTDFPPFTHTRDSRTRRIV